ncbi:hypothetical protein BKA69DRAFT_1065472 [Paraphysoderma sedebokerense]|nr:hypothetical protein BKA69DRAFT_1065472 [Paraphysoderma sedebokerense]
MMSVETTNEALETSHTLSASSVVKSLKSSNLSHEEKLELALKAWKSDTVLIPKKLEFLLDWCTNSMVKSTGWNDKTFGRTPTLSTHYWDFYHTLLHHAHSVTNSLYLVITALKTPLVPLYISTLSDFRNSLSNSQINENVEGWTSLLDRIYSSLLIILKESSGTRWTLDGLCSIVGEVLACLNVSVQKDRINSTLLEKECQIAIEVMKNLVTMIRSQANLKKTFNTVVTKFLKPIALFHLHIDSMKTPSKFVTAVQQQTSLVVQYGLFHIDHIPEYIQLFRPTFAKFLESNDKSSNSKSKSHTSGKDLSRYQKVLFESLKSNLPVENSDSKMDDEEDQWIASAVLNFIPKLYATFLSSFRSYVSHQQSKLTLSNGRDSSTMLINRAAPFAFFCELRSIIYTNIDAQRTLLIDSSTSTDYLIQVLKTDNMLLDLVLEKNVYQDLNDSVAKWMRQYLLDISKQSVDLMEAIWKLPLSNEFAHPLQNVVIQRWDILLRLNNSIVDPHLEPIFAKFVQAHPDCYDVIKTFLISAIQMYDRSRQFESFISTLLKCLHILSNKQDWDCHAIFDDSVLQKFGSVVATLPPLQTLSILSSFVDATSSLMPPPSSKEVTKKRKLTPSLHVDVSNGSTTLFPVTVFFSWFLRHMRLSENQLSKLKVLSERAWSELISHLPTLLPASKSADQVFNLVTPLISLHVEWTESSVPYSDIITVDNSTLARTLIESFHSIIKSPEMVHPSIVATAIHAVVQYVAVFLRTRPVDANEYERLRVLMSDVFHAANMDKTANDDYPWSGKAWEISSDNMMTAWWMTIVRYFDIVCMFISEDISKKVAGRVIQVLSGRNSKLENWKSPQKQETLRSVTIKMLHAATFYELSPIRGTFFNALIQEIESRLTSNKSGDLSTSKTTIVPFIEALSLFPIEAMTKNEKETLFSIMIDFEKAYLSELENTDLWDLCRAVERRSAGSHLLSLELFQWFTETTLSQCRMLLASQSPSASVVSALENTAEIIKHFVLALLNRLHQPTDTHISSFSRMLENFCQLVQSSLNVEPPKDCNFSPDKVGVALLAPSLSAIMEWFETRAKKGNLQGDIKNAVLSNFDKLQQYTMTQISNYQNILMGDDEQAKNESIVNISHILPILNVIVRFAKSRASEIRLPDLLPPAFSTIYTACSLSNENSNIKSVYPPLVAALCEYFNDIKETSSAISIGNMMDLILLWMDKCSYDNGSF